eukprot:scaffold9697_cov114-Skeletonema_dohrnii-CCMP3373.AAC.7
MPSRKKAKGKARKAAKAQEEAAKVKEECEAVTVPATASANQRQHGLLEAQMQRLQINAVNPQKCRHGLAPLSPGEQKICLEFINAFATAFTAEGDEVDAFFSTHEMTREYANVHSSKLETHAVLISKNSEVKNSFGSRCPRKFNSISPSIEDAPSVKGVI